MAGLDLRPTGGESLSDDTALLGHAEKTPMVKRHELYDVKTGSVSEIVITDTDWQLSSQGVVPNR